MCGRYAITLPPDAVRAFFRFAEQPNFPPRYNVAPTQPVPVVTMERLPDGGRSRHFVLMRWGFLPGFVKDPKDFPLVINARAESVAEKPSFRNAFKRRRCIFIADAFYEWKRYGTGKGAPPAQPYLFRRRDGEPMALAGLWESWTGPNGEEMDTACILTTTANDTMAPIHDRMPVILEPEDFDRWLDGETDAKDVAGLVKPAAADVLEFYAISTDVNRVANDNPEVQKPLGSEVGALPPVVQQPGSAAKVRARATKKAAQGSLF